MKRATATTATFGETMKAIVAAWFSSIRKGVARKGHFRMKNQVTTWVKNQDGTWITSTVAGRPVRLDWAVFPDGKVEMNLASVPPRLMAFDIRRQPNAVMKAAAELAATPNLGGVVKRGLKALAEGGSMDSVLRKLSTSGRLDQGIQNQIPLVKSRIGAELRTDGAPRGWRLSQLDLAQGWLRGDYSVLFFLAKKLGLDPTKIVAVSTAIDLSAGKRLPVDAARYLKGKATGQVAVVVRWDAKAEPEEVRVKAFCRIGKTAQQLLFCHPDWKGSVVEGMAEIGSANFAKELRSVGLKVNPRLSGILGSSWITRQISNMVGKLHVRKLTKADATAAATEFEVPAGLFQFYMDLCRVNGISPSFEGVRSLLLKDVESGLDGKIFGSARFVGRLAGRYFPDNTELIKFRMTLDGAQEVELADGSVEFLNGLIKGNLQVVEGLGVDLLTYESNITSDQQFLKGWDWICVNHPKIGVDQASVDRQLMSMIPAIGRLFPEAVRAFTNTVEKFIHPDSRRSPKALAAYLKSVDARNAGESIDRDFPGEETGNTADAVRALGKMFLGLPFLRRAVVDALFHGKNTESKILEGSINVPNSWATSGYIQIDRGLVGLDGSIHIGGCTLPPLFVRMDGQVGPRLETRSPIANGTEFNVKFATDIEIPWAIWHKAYRSTKKVVGLSEVPNGLAAKAVIARNQLLFQRFLLKVAIKAYRLAKKAMAAGGADAPKALVFNDAIGVYQESLFGVAMCAGRNGGRDFDDRLTLWKGKDVVGSVLVDEDKVKEGKVVQKAHWIPDMSKAPYAVFEAYTNADVVKDSRPVTPASVFEEYYTWIAKGGLLSVGSWAVKASQAWVTLEWLYRQTRERPFGKTETFWLDAPEKDRPNSRNVRKSAPSNLEKDILRWLLSPVTLAGVDVRVYQILQLLVAPGLGESLIDWCNQKYKDWSFRLVAVWKAIEKNKTLREFTPAGCSGFSSQFSDNIMMLPDKNYFGAGMAMVPGLPVEDQKHEEQVGSLALKGFWSSEGNKCHWGAQFTSRNPRTQRPVRAGVMWQMEQMNALVSPAGGPAYVRLSKDEERAHIASKGGRMTSKWARQTWDKFLRLDKDGQIGVWVAVLQFLEEALRVQLPPRNLIPATHYVNREGEICQNRQFFLHTKGKVWEDKELVRVVGPVDWATIKKSQFLYTMWGMRWEFPTLSGAPTPTPEQRELARRLIVGREVAQLADSWYFRPGTGATVSAYAVLRQRFDLSMEESNHLWQNRLFGDGLLNYHPALTVWVLAQWGQFHKPSTPNEIHRVGISAEDLGRAHDAALVDFYYGSEDADSSVPIPEDFGAELAEGAEDGYLGHDDAIGGYTDEDQLPDHGAPDDLPGYYSREEEE